MNRPNRTTVAPVVDSAEVAQGDLLALVMAADSAAANRGKLVRATTDINRLVVGWCQDGSRTGDTAGTITATAFRDLGDVQRELEVTGVTGASQVGAPVYATAHGTYTLTQSARSWLIGIVAAYVSAGRAMVAALDGPMLAQMVVTRETVNLGTIVLSGTNTIKTLLKWPVPYRCRLSAVSAYYAVAAAGASATSALTFRRDPLGSGTGHVSVVGGAITLATGAQDVEGGVKAGSAITGGNDLYEGDILEGRLDISAAGTFTGGTVNVRAIINRFPGN